MMMVRLENFMVTRGGSLNPANYPAEKFELYSIPAHDNGGPEVLPGAEIGSSKQVVQPGDILVSKIIPHIRRARVVGNYQGLRQIASGEWIVFRGGRLHPRYMKHFLVSDTFHWKFMNTVAGVGGSLVRARPEHVKSIEVPLPSLEEQERIAGILDQADAIRAKRRQVLAHLDTLSQSIFHDMFASSSHTYTTLGELCTFYSGGTPSKRNDDYWSGALPWFSAKDLKSDNLYDSQDHISERVPAETSIRLLPKGTVVLVVRGMILSRDVPICILRVQATINQDLKAVIPQGKVDTEFLAAAIRSQTAWILARTSTAAHGTKKIESHVLGAVPVPVASQEAQREFATRAEQVNAQRQLVQRALDADNELFASLQSRAFRGEL